MIKYLKIYVNHFCLSKAKLCQSLSQDSTKVSFNDLKKRNIPSSDRFLYFKKIPQKIFNNIIIKNIYFTKNSNAEKNEDIAITNKKYLVNLKHLQLSSYLSSLFNWIRWNSKVKHDWTCPSSNY